MTTDTPYVDLQVNGYGGIDFNSDCSVNQIEAGCERLVADGVGTILATIITDDLDRMVERTRAIAAACAASDLVHRVVRGVHLEGPFISAVEGYVGAHPVAAVRPANVPDVERLVDAGEGLVCLVTLAPEADVGGTTTRWLTDRGIRVAAGHCNPSLDELDVAIDNGLTLFTHLGNGCPKQMDRHDNVIQRVLSRSDRLWTCFIADGIHVPFPALRNYLCVTGIERTIIVSDAIAAAGLGPGEYLLGQQPVVVDEQLATWSADRQHLVGSATSMRVAFEKLQHELGLPEDAARRLTRDNPMAAMGW